MSTAPDPHRHAPSLDPELATSVLAKESYEILSTIFAGTDDRVFVKDQNGRYLMLNSSVAEYFQRPIAEIVGHTDWELLPPDRARFFAASDRLVLNTGESTSYEVKTPDSQRAVWIYTTKSPVRDKHGRIVGVIGIGRDITARKHAEKALQLSETRLAAAQALAHLGSWEWNLRNNDVVWSTECYRIFGIEPQSFSPTYADVVHLFHPTNAERFRNVLSAAIRGGVEFKDDFRIIRPTGEERYIHVEGVVTEHSAAGTPLIMSGTAHDITQSKHAELALRRSEKNFAHAQRIAQVGSWEWEPSTGRTVWSEEARRIFGVVENKPLLQAEFLQHVHPEDRATVAAALDATLSKEVPYDVTCRIVRGPENAERIVQVLGEFHLNDDGVPVMTGVYRDITDERRLHDRLARSETDLAQAQRIARIASWRWDLYSGTETWSAAIYEILGVDATAPMSFRRFVEFVRPEDRASVSTAFNSTMAGSAPHALDFRIIAAGGRERFIHSVGETVHAPDGTAISVVGTLQDITERKLIEGELATSRDELRELTHHLQHLQEDDRRRIAREIHDEFGAVFTAANLSLYRLASMLQNAPPQARELLVSTKEMIANAGKSLDDIVNGLHPQMLSHLGLVATMEWYIAEFEKRTGIHCIRTLPDESVPVDEQLALTLFRCAQESLTNIAKHADASDVEIVFTLDADRASLTVTDNGRGFSLESLNTPEAFGLRGLQARINQLGGKLRLQPIAPHGTRLAVTLPSTTQPVARTP